MTCTKIKIYSQFEQHHDHNYDLFSVVFSFPQNQHCGGRVQSLKGQQTSEKIFCDTVEFVPTGKSEPKE